MKTINWTCATALVAALIAAIGCQKTQQPNTQASESKTPELQTSGNFLLSPQEAKKLLNSYPQYDELRHPDLDKVVESLPEYRQAVADHDARINTKVGSISDPELRQNLIKQAGIPEVNKYDFQELAKKEIDRQRTAFLAEHKDCYFILGTYDFYLVKRQMVVFNLQKMGVYEHADDFVRENGFGASIPYYRKNKSGDYVDEHGKYQNPVEFYANAGENFLTINDSASDMPSRISSRYSPDGFDYFAGGGTDTVINHGLLVPIPLEQLDKIYSAVRSKFSKQMDDIYASEMKAGGDNSYLDGHFETYCDHLPCDVLKKHIESYVRRQAIWVLAQGDPMNPQKIQVDKAWVVVGGPEIFGTLK